jgi:hypothetical protein
MEWYDGVGVHGSMWGICVPPGLSLVKDRPMGTLWEKRLVGTTVHASHILMSRHIHKALTHPILFPNDDFGDHCHDIVSTSEGCGYASLHNTMRLAHPYLCDKVVDTTIPYQGNTVSFAAHVRNMTQYLARKKLGGRLYTKCEALMMTLETLQAHFRVQMKHKVGILFQVGHNKVDNIPFKLAMSNFATPLTSWAKELNLDVPRGTKGGRVNHLATDQGLGIGGEDNDVNHVWSDKQCDFCNIPGHTSDDCQLFINFLMAYRFTKQHPDLVGATLKKHSIFIRIRPPGRGRPVNNLDMGPNSNETELELESTTQTPSHTFIAKGGNNTVYR